MKTMLFLVLALITVPVLAGELWEVVSVATGPDGSPLRDTQRHCLPAGGMDPAKMLSDLGDCRFDQKSGDAAAFRFSMTCTPPGMSADFGSVRVAGDARLLGAHFDMRYRVTLGDPASLAMGELNMAGTAEAHRVGACSEH